MGKIGSVSQNLKCHPVQSWMAFLSRNIFLKGKGPLVRYWIASTISFAMEWFVVRTYHNLMTTPGLYRTVIDSWICFSFYVEHSPGTAINSC